MSQSSIVRRRSMSACQAGQGLRLTATRDTGDEMFATPRSGRAPRVPTQPPLWCPSPHTHSRNRQSSNRCTPDPPPPTAPGVWGHQAPDTRHQAPGSATYVREESLSPDPTVASYRHCPWQGAGACEVMSRRRSLARRSGSREDGGRNANNLRGQGSGSGSGTKTVPFALEYGYH
jgi:hypothetical protein